MSAYLCDAEHISACADIIIELATDPYCKSPLKEDDTPGNLFNMFLNENLKSLHARYSDTEEWDDDSAFMVYAPQNICVFIGDANVPKSTFQEMNSALKALQCFNYQSCEHSTWEDSHACHLISWAIEVLALKIATNTPEYELAEWGWKSNQIPICF